MDFEALFDPSAVRSKVAEYMSRLAELAEEVQRAKASDDEKVRALSEAQSHQRDELQALKRILANTRSPSKAAAIGGNTIGDMSTAYGGTSSPGTFLKAVMDAGSRHAHEQAEGRATLEAFSRFSQGQGKAALGSTAATGGWIIPNAQVDEIIKPGLFTNVCMDLMIARRGVTAPSVDMPYRNAQPACAQVAAFGASKENVDLPYQGYTATMYTLARIHDVGAQFVRQSAGAAEADVMSELSDAFARGAGCYIGQGTGSSEPFGITGAITAAPFSPNIVTTHTAAANTVAGAVASAIAKAAGALMARDQTPTGAVVSSDVPVELLTNGADNAGFYVAGLGVQGRESPFAPGTLVSPWGVPVYVDSNHPNTDDLWIADWRKFRVYVGQEFRIDSSTEAGTRWDTNLFGFRGEMELGFDARPAVDAGALQTVADVLS